MPWVIQPMDRRLAHVLLSLFVLVVASVMLWVALVRLREPRMSRAAK